MDQKGNKTIMSHLVNFQDTIFSNYNCINILGTMFLTKWIFNE